MTHSQKEELGNINGILLGILSMGIVIGGILGIIIGALLWY